MLSWFLLIINFLCIRECKKILFSFSFVQFQFSASPSRSLSHVPLDRVIIDDTVFVCSFVKKNKCDLKLSDRWFLQSMKCKKERFRLTVNSRRTKKSVYICVLFYRHDAASTIQSDGHSLIDFFFALDFDIPSILEESSIVIKISNKLEQIKWISAYRILLFFGQHCCCCCCRCFYHTVTFFHMFCFVSFPSLFGMHSSLFILIVKYFSTVSLLFSRLINKTVFICYRMAACARARACAYAMMN